MIRALDKQKRDTLINNSVDGEEYFCPICNGKVFRKMGNGVRRPHFAHSSDPSRSCDTWKSDMSDWHIAWQEKFPEDCREKVVTFEGEKHRADVLIEERKLVIEFQHSNLPAGECEERNRFYKKCGYNIVWIFDMSEDFDNERFVLQEDGKSYLWKRPWSAFREMHMIYDCGRNRQILGAEHVFFEHSNLVEELLSYDSTKREVKTSALQKNKPYFWSKFTLENWLQQYRRVERLDVPKCPKCKINMRIRQFSISQDYFWGCANYSKKNCTERLGFGRSYLPVPVFLYGTRCPFCGDKIYADDYEEACLGCGFKVIFDRVES